MPRTTKSTTDAAASQTGGDAAPAIDPAAYYRVEAPGRFNFRSVAFGPLVRTEVDGAFLTELLAAPEGAGVASYTLVNG